MTDLSTKTALVIDNGLFLSLAQRMAESYGRVLYHVPYQNGFPKTNNGLIGKGVPGIDICYAPWKMIDAGKVDIVICPDVGNGDMHHHLRSIGIPVWGCGISEDLEFDRVGTKEWMVKNNLPVGPYEVVKGVTALRAYLQEHKNQVVKLPEWRGHGETFKAKNYRLVSWRLDKLAHELGDFQEELEFVVEQMLTNRVEVGIDGYAVDGQFPSMIMCGLEVKDMGYCYDNQTEVLTDAGWKFFRDVTEVDSVLTLDISDTQHMKMEYQRPQRHVRYVYSGKMLSIESTNVSMMVTPDHNMLMQVNEQSKRKLSLVIAKQIAIDKQFSMPHPGGASFISHTPKPKRLRFGQVTLTLYQYAQLMGLYLSEGHTRKKGTHYESSISQEKYVAEFATILEGMPFEVKRVGNSFRIYDQDLNAHLHEFGLSRQKNVPTCIKHSSKRIINAFLDAFCLGDGSRRDTFKQSRGNITKKTARTFYTISGYLADDLQEMMLMIGNPSTILHHSKRPEALQISERTINKKNYISPGQAKWVEYSGEVFCVTVPNSIIMVRRNGKPIWSGNCGKIVSYDSIPDCVTQFSKAVGLRLKREGFRSFYSDETRVGKDHVGYMIDPCMRCGSPPNEVYQNNYTNLADIIWEGAGGVLVEPKYEYRYGVEIMIHCTWAEREWAAIQFPKAYESQIKLRNACKVHGQWGIIPQAVGMPEIGAVVGSGHTLKEAIAHAKEAADTIEGDGIEIAGGSIAEAMQSLEEGKAMGIDIWGGK